MADLLVNDNGTNKQPREVWVNDGGTLKPVQEVWVRDGDTMVKVWPQAPATAPMIYTVQGAAGVARNYLPINSQTSVVDLFVDWGDGTSEQVTSLTHTHTYAADGEYEIQFSGVIDSMKFYQNDVTTAVRNVKAFGDFRPDTSRAQMFFYATGLVEISATDWHNLDGENIGQLFRGCANLTACSPPTTEAPIISGMFRGCSKMVGVLDVSGLKIVGASSYNLDYMFQNCTANIVGCDQWDVSQLTSAVTMFTGSGLTTAELDKLLVAWAAQTVQSGVTFDAPNTNYTIATSQAAIDTLTTAGWTINTAGGI